MKNNSRNQLLFIFAVLFTISVCIPVLSNINKPVNRSQTPTPSIVKDNTEPFCNSTVVNPAGSYCALLGYDHKIVETSLGQEGMCIFPDGSKCEEWDFYAGKCAQEYSYCALHGYEIQTKADGNDPFSEDYAICIDKDGAILGTVSYLSGLQMQISNCGNE